MIVLQQLPVMNRVVCSGEIQKDPVVTMAWIVQMLTGYTCVAIVPSHLANFATSIWKFLMGN